MSETPNAKDALDSLYEIKLRLKNAIRATGSTLTDYEPYSVYPDKVIHMAEKFLDIRNAIKRKRVTISDNETFDVYDIKINQIKSIYELGLGDLYACPEADLGTEPTTGNVKYVIPDGAGLKDGSSWSNAFASIQDAINACTSGDRVYIMQGVYNITSPLELKLNVSVYGGFDPDDKTFAGRKPFFKETKVDCGHLVISAINQTEFDFADGQVVDGIIAYNAMSNAFMTTSKKTLFKHCGAYGCCSLSLGGAGFRNVTAIRCASIKCNANGLGGGGFYANGEYGHYTMCHAVLCHAVSGGGFHLQGDISCEDQPHAINCLSAMCDAIAGGGFYGTGSTTQANGVYTNYGAYISGCVSIECSAANTGGGFGLSFGRELVGCVAIHCTAMSMISTGNYGGGGIYVSNMPNAVDGCMIVGCASGKFGSGIQASSSSVTNCVIINCQTNTGFGALYAEALYENGLYISISNNTIINCQANNTCGGIVVNNRYSGISIDNCPVLANNVVMNCGNPSYYTMFDSNQVSADSQKVARLLNCAGDNEVQSMEGMIVSNTEYKTIGSLESLDFDNTGTFYPRRGLIYLADGSRNAVENGMFGEYQIGESSILKYAGISMRGVSHTIDMWGRTTSNHTPDHDINGVTRPEYTPSIGAYDILPWYRPVVKLALVDGEVAGDAPVFIKYASTSLYPYDETFVSMQPDSSMYSVSGTSLGTDARPWSIITKNSTYKDTIYNYCSELPATKYLTSSDAVQYAQVQNSGIATSGSLDLALSQYIIGGTCVRKAHFFNRYKVISSRTDGLSQFTITKYYYLRVSKDSDAIQESVTTFEMDADTGAVTETHWYEEYAGYMNMSTYKATYNPTDITWIAEY